MRSFEVYAVNSRGLRSAKFLVLSIFLVSFFCLWQTVSVFGQNKANDCRVVEKALQRCTQERSEAQLAVDVKANNTHYRTLLSDLNKAIANRSVIELWEYALLPSVKIPNYDGAFLTTEERLAHQRAIRAVLVRELQKVSDIELQDLEVRLAGIKEEISIWTARKKEIHCDEIRSDGVPGGLGEKGRGSKPREMPTDEVPAALGSSTGRPPVKDNSGERPGVNRGSNTSGSDGLSTSAKGPFAKGVRPCTADETGLFNRMSGSWRSISLGPNITISGSCEQASGTISYREYCERPDAEYNKTLKNYEVAFSGRIEGVSLQVDYQKPGNSKEKGAGSCEVGSDGNLSCRGLPCNVSAKKQ